MINKQPQAEIDHQGSSVRQNESTGLRALFEKVFFDVPCSPAALAALDRTKFCPAGPKTDGAELDAGAPVQKAERSPDEHVGPVLDDQPRTVLLYRGESGVGKTRIFRRFRGYAQERQIPVYEIHCYDVEGIPFKPFLRVIREILRDFEFGDVLREKYRSGLEALLPEVFATDGADAGSVATPDWDVKHAWEDDKRQIFDGITRLLFEITALHPVVILVHDLNWGDQATIELIRYIGRSARLRNARFEGWHRADDPLPVEAWWEAEEDWVEDAERLDFPSGASRGGAPRGVLLTGLRGGDGGEGYSTENVEDRAVRLMIVANYQGTTSEGGYLERALRGLGKETFAYHGEIRRLAVEETRSLLDSATGGRVEDDVVERVHGLTEGFPSFIHELLRLLTHSDGSGRVAGTLTVASIDQVFGSVGGQGAADGEGQPVDSPCRHEILRQRLRAVQADELALLQALALARKPLTLQHLCRVLDRPADDVGLTLGHLEEKCLLERVAQLFPRGGEEDGYYFRIGDYPDVVGEGIDDGAERTSLHQRIGEEIRQQVQSGRDEKNFEAFYHLRRGLEPRSSVDYGWLAASRFARSFAIEKAVLLLDDLLGVLDVETDGDLWRSVDILERKAAYHMALSEPKKALEALGRILEQGGAVVDDPSKAEVYMHEGEVHRVSGDTNRALKSFTRAFKFIKDIDSLLGVRWHLAAARVRKDRGDVKRATNLCLKGIKICQKHLGSSPSETTAEEAETEVVAAASETPEIGLRLQSRLHRLLAQTFILRGDSVHAAENFRRALEGVESLGDEPATAQVLDDLGTVYLEQGTYFRAARYFYRALEIKRRCQDIAGLCVSYDQLGLVYLRTGDELKTIAHLTHSLHLKERIGDLLGLNSTLGVMGELHARLGQYTTALSLFDREIHNSELINDTTGLVDAFVRKGWLYYEMGDLKQVDGLTRQTGILASEFKLRFQEAASARLRGRFEMLGRRWDEAEMQLKKAGEIYAKIGNRRHEAKVLLDQALLKYDREFYDDALKLASKAMVLADQLKAVDLQARSHLVKGNVFRFLKGGSKEKACKHLDRAFELGKGVNDLHRLFDIYYSLAKLHHYDRSFLEAGNYYGKAEAILRRVADDLPDQLAARYFEDSRRRVFLEDANRFRREVQGRSTHPEPALQPESEERAVGVEDLRELNARVVRIGAAQSRPDFYDVVLAEAIDLARSDRCVLFRVRNRQYSFLAQTGFGDDPERAADFPSAQSMAEDAIRKGKSSLVTGSGSGTKDSDFLKPGGGLDQRSVLVVAVKTPERIYGALYLDRPVGAFSRVEQELLERFCEHVGIALDNRRIHELAIREPLTGLFTTACLLERLRESYRLNNLHGRSFFLVGFYLPTLEASMSDEARLVGERLAAEIGEELPPTALASWGSPILSILVTDVTLPSVDSFVQRIETRLIQMVNSKVAYHILGPEARLPNGVSLYYELRRTLLPEESDQQTLIEIRDLLSREMTLKDAKLILEKHIIENALRKTGGNITHAARELGIHRPQLSGLLKKHELKRERFERAAAFGEDVDVEARKGRRS